MAPDINPTEEAPNRCDVVVDDDRAKERPPAICMSRFLADMTAQGQIQRTADYAKDPSAYLKSILGASIVDKRKDLLCIPEKVDKDIYGNGEHKTHFQQHIANLLGKKHGLFFITGVQAQLAAIKAHCDRAGNNRVAWHVTSHLEEAEEKSFRKLYGLERTLLGGKEDELPTVAGIRNVINLPHDQRPAAILLELPNRTLGCATYTFSDLQEISTACHQSSVKLHCDGARLWEIEPYYQQTAGKTFTDIAALFDTVYVSFYKGLRGATGAMLGSDDEKLIQWAKSWQRRAGGNAFTLMYEVIDCERGYNENIGTFAEKWAKMTDIVNGVTSATADFSTKEGERIVRFVPEKAMCCQIRTAFRGYTVDELTAARDRVQDKLNVRVFERIWPKESLDEQAEKEREKSGEENGVNGNDADMNGEGAKQEDEEDRDKIIEWMIVSALLEVDTQICVDAYVALCEELVSAHSEGKKG